MRAYIYTRVLGTSTTSHQHNIFDSETLSQFCCVLLTGFEPRAFGSRVRRCTHWATPPLRLPWVRSPNGAGWEAALLSLRINSCGDLFVPDTPPPTPPACVRHAPIFVHTLKIPYPSVVKKYASQPVVWVTHTHIAYARLVINWTAYSWLSRPD